jgi:hypothetical protein
MPDCVSSGNPVYITVNGKRRLYSATNSSARRVTVAWYWQRVVRLLDRAEFPISDPKRTSAPGRDAASGEAVYIPLMQIKKPHLVADVERDDVSKSLSAWSWLLEDGWSPLLVSAVGEVFLANSAGAVARLDTGAGKLERLADSLRLFEAALDDPAIIADWFLVPVADELRSQGKQLSPGQGYGFTLLPIFAGGSYEPGNRFCLSATEHIGFSGDMHSQLRDVPDGDSVNIVVRN